jgi:general secretion pathway protein A
VQTTGPGPATIIEPLDPPNAHLLQSHAEGRHSVLIIDEAQSLSADVLEQLRLLTNLETNERKLLQIILIGQPELRQMLARPELEQLAQRVIARFHLDALSEEETRQYIAHRMGVAGWQGPPPFTTKALRQVHRLTGGVPRRINLLCDRALLGAYATSQTTVDHHVIAQAAGEVFDGQAKPAPGKSTAVRSANWWPGLALGAVGGALLFWGTTALLNPALQVPQAPLAGPQPTAAPVAPEAPVTPSASVQARENRPSTPEAAVSDLAQWPPGPPPSDAWISKEDDGFRALSVLWGRALSSDNPCLEARNLGLQCYRTPRMTINGLRQLDRPALLRLQLSGQPSGYVLATAITDEAVELRIGEQRWRMPLSTLSSVWKGYYATLWRTPPGQQDRLNNGYAGTAAQWMERQLTALQEQGELPASAQTLQEKVEAFQRAKGVEINGRASPTTLILINRATGVDEPRLVQPGL